MVEIYGRQFARVVRERWAMGACNEDILFLIVIKRPEQVKLTEYCMCVHLWSLQLVRNSANGQQPVRLLIGDQLTPTIVFQYIFVSVGSLVQERADHIVTRENKTLQQLVNALNEKLEHGYTLNAVSWALTVAFVGC
jgi:hypothetical protein